MRRSSARRAQIEPFAALAAVVVIALALGLYAATFEESLPEPLDRNVAEPTADRVERALTAGGVVRPGRLANVSAVGPDGYQVNVTLGPGPDRASVGPTPPDAADDASRRVSVLRAPGTVDPARLEVAVWI